MTRLAEIDPDTLSGDLRAYYDTANPRDRMLFTPTAHAPELMGALHHFADVLGEKGTLPGRLVELVRLRIAFHNQCRSCMAMRFEPALEDGLTEDLVCSLEKPVEAPDLTDAEKAALDFADRFATNHLSIGDETVEGLRRYYTEQEVIEICMMCAYCTGFGRFAAVYHAVEDLPESYQNTSRITAPWSADHTEQVVVPG